MMIIPAIDLKDGKCVRLAQGDFSRVTVYSDNPSDIARMWQTKGAKRIHVVDLDGSRAGIPKNREAVKNIVEAIDIPLQLGGGIRDMNTIDAYFLMGVSRVVIGTSALKDPAFVQESCRTYRGRIILGIDARDGVVAVEGWTEASSLSPLVLAKRYEEYDLDAIVYTDIKRDGMESGVNIEATKALAQAVQTPVIASGGVSSIRDIKSLCEIEDFGVTGVIIGRSLYTGALSLEEAIQVASIH